MYFTRENLKIEIIPVTMILQNCMLIWDQSSNQGVITDPGGDLDTILSAIESNGVEVQAILLTHGHFDHVGATMALQERLEQKQGGTVPILGPLAEDKFLLDNVVENMRYFQLDLPDVQDVVPTRFVKDGEVLSFDGINFEVIHVPGHTPGHVVFYEPKAKIMVTGDTLFKGTVGRSDLPYGNGALLLDRIRNRLLPLGDDIYILPGHGMGSTIGAEKRSNPFLL